jgi:hypothetical protein
MSQAADHPSLFEAMLARDEPEIRRAIRSERREADELLREIAGFAVLAFNSSQHSRHAFVAAGAASALAPHSPPWFESLLEEVAIYAANGRLPWSEAPIIERPEPSGRREPCDLTRVLADRDGDAAERWLSSILDDPDFEARYFAAAAAAFGELGQDLVLAQAAWRISRLVPAEYRFGLYRAPLAAWLADGVAATPADGGSGAISEKLVDALVRARGSVDRFQLVAAWCAAVEASEQWGTLEIAQSAAARIASALPAGEEKPVDARPAGELPPPVYRLSRDLAGYLQAWAIPEARCASDEQSRRIREAAWDNLRHGPDFDEESFA